MWRTEKTKNDVLQKLRRNNLITVLDTETVGLEPGCQIIQFSAERYSYIRKPFQLRLAEKPFNIFIRPHEPISPRITKLTGITNEYLSGCLGELAAFPYIHRFMENRGIIVGYNVGFDLDKIGALFQRNGKDFYTGDVIDVLQMARDCIPKDKVENYKLATIAAYFKADAGISFHSSLDDITTTRRVFMCCLQKYLQDLNKNEDVKRTYAYMNYCYYWINPNKPSMRRLIVDTSIGRLYYDTVGRSWGVNKNSRLNINSINMEDLESQCLRRYRCQDMDALSRYMQKRSAEKEAKTIS